MIARCDAEYYERHDCDDPAGCAIDRLIRAPYRPDEGELDELRAAIEAIQELIAGKKTVSTAKVEEALP